MMVGGGGDEWIMLIKEMNRSVRSKARWCIEKEDITRLGLNFRTTLFLHI